MTNQLVCMPANLRVGDARRNLKDRIGAPDFANYLYVVDTEEERHLQGVVSLREFAVADDEQLIGALMNPGPNRAGVVARPSTESFLVTLESSAGRTRGGYPNRRRRSDSVARGRAESTWGAPVCA